MRLFPLAAALAALLVPAAPAVAGDPTMPLWQVHAGMRCTGYSVIQGTTISAFDVQVLDVAGGEATASAARILIQVSGPAVDATGLGPGFSGSPIYCPDAAGVARNIGAVSESVNEYGGKIALATPIEAILGTPIDVPGKATSTRMRAAMARAKPLASPLTVSGLSAPVANALTAAAAKLGRPVLAAPPGPLGSFAPQVLQPGSAVAVGYSTGDVHMSAIGTVAYVDGDRVWAFGHALEGVGRRALLLQDAYVFRIINNPNQLGGQVGATYKLASSGHDLGTVTSDGFNAVAGRTGPPPHTVPVHVLARDEDAKADLAVNAQAADEAAVDLPSGGSWTSFIAPLTLVQSTGVLDSAPTRLTGELCARIGLAELKKPLRFCNRYVSVTAGQSDDGSAGNAVSTGAAADLSGALSAIDAYTGKPPHVTGVSALLKLRRGADQAFMRDISLPASVRPGQRVRVRVALQRVRGAKFTRTYTLRIPADARRGRQRLTLVGQDADQGDSGFATIILGEDNPRDAGGVRGPGTLRELAAQINATARYDGVSVRIGRARGEAFRDDDFRISGQAEATVRVTAR